MPYEVVTLRNGARALRDTVSGEVMHPSVGPWEEAQTLYVRQVRLGERLTFASEEPVRIWDVGLGGAANAAAALACARDLGPKRRRALELVSFEVDTGPLRLALSDEGFGFLVPWREAAQTLLARGRFDGDGVTWTLCPGDALAAFAGAPGPPEVVFFDPFSPETNPALWTPEAFGRVRRRSREEGAGTVLVTYSASTRTRVSLLLAGFHVGVGVAVGTKKETTVAATRAGLLERPLGQRWLERWRRSSSRAPWGGELTREVEAQVEGHPQFVPG